MTDRDQTDHQLFSCQANQHSNDRERDN